jgi:Lon protease (S16) C-terminal proteolytic domain
MVTAMVSTLTGIPVRADIAMTGEVTLRGRVLAIGGLKEKLLAALRGGIKTVLIPEENRKDLAEIPANIQEGLEIIPVSHVDEVLALALVEPVTPIEWTEADELASHAAAPSLASPASSPTAHSPARRCGESESIPYRIGRCEICANGNNRSLCRISSKIVDIVAFYGAFGFDSCRKSGSIPQPILEAIPISHLSLPR